MAGAPTHFATTRRLKRLYHIKLRCNIFAQRGNVLYSNTLALGMPTWPFYCGPSDTKSASDQFWEMPAAAPDSNCNLQVQLPL